MGNDLIGGNSTGDLIGLFHTKHGEIELPKAFGQEIFLFYTKVAGTNHIQNLEEISIEIGDKLNFFREPENPYDKKAILIKTQLGDKLGYVPRADNVIFSRLMDAGKVLYARVSALKSDMTDWEPIQIKIFLEN
ncbi:MAG: HIRAN domain-containing protein [Streptococcaceae bacterium]|jgi:hypothetical protein|nr:HIRAN domain-containing protein [Streptococcaceae bacterium]